MKIEERRERYEQYMKPAVIDGDSTINPRNTGGWAQYGEQIDQ